MRRWEINTEEDNEIEQLYQHSLTIVRVIEENRKLKAQNAHLSKRLKERDQFIDDQYKQTLSQVGGILSVLINMEEQKR